MRPASSAHRLLWKPAASGALGMAGFEERFSSWCPSFRRPPRRPDLLQPIEMGTPRRSRGLSFVSLLSPRTLGLEDRIDESHVRALTACTLVRLVCGAIALTSDWRFPIQVSG